VDRSSLVLGACFGLLFAAALVVNHALDFGHSVRLAVAGFLFGAYCIYALWPSFQKKRPKRRSLLVQAALGGALGVTVAILFGGTGEVVGVAAVLGVMLGFFADIWVKHVPLP
jgi:peptidoglycan/LPS O-acetylase OafA/YrhL